MSAAKESKIVWWLMGIVSALLVALIVGFSASRASRDSLDANTKALDNLEVRVSKIADQMVTAAGLTAATDRVAAIERERDNLRSAVLSQIAAVETRLSEQIGKLDDRITALTRGK